MVALFNFQGAVSLSFVSLLLSVTAYLLYHILGSLSTPFQNFFSSFFVVLSVLLFNIQNFQGFLFARFCLNRLHSRASRFLRFCSLFLSILCVPVSRRLVYNTTLFRFCQAFSILFFDFYLCYKIRLFLLRFYGILFHSCAFRVSRSLRIIITRRLIS